MAFPVKTDVAKQNAKVNFSNFSTGSSKADEYEKHFAPLLEFQPWFKNEHDFEENLTSQLDFKLRDNLTIKSCVESILSDVKILEELKTLRDVTLVRQSADIDMFGLEELFTIYVKQIGINAAYVSLVVSSLVNLAIIIYNLNKTKDFKFGKTLLVSNVISMFTTIIIAYNGSVDSTVLTDLEQIAQASTGEINDNSKLDLSGHYAQLCKSRSVEAARLYIYENNLEDKINLPKYSWYEIKQNYSDSKFSWIFGNFTDEFLSMWYSVPTYNIIKFRELMVQNLQRQSSDLDEWYLKSFGMIKQFISVIINFTVCKLSGKQFTCKQVLDTMLDERLDKLSGNLANDIAQHFGISTKTQLFNEQLITYTQKLNDFMNTPNYQFGIKSKYIYEVADLLKNCEQFIFVSSKNREFQPQLSVLSGLFTAASQRKNEIITNVLPNLIRQEPFVVLLQGKGGIGKTRLMMKLLEDVGDVCELGDFSESFISVTPESKYWPPLSGQTIALFDETGDTMLYKEDLLLNNIKGLCSPAFFNCEAADIAHKVNPCPFKVIGGTTNTNIDTFQARLSECKSPDSVYPVFRRMIVVCAEWNESLSKYDHNSLDNEYFDDFSHLILNLYEYDIHTGRMQLSKTINYATLLAIVKDRFMRNENKHKLALSKDSCKRQSHNMHFSVNLFGPGGNGKTPKSLELESYLTKAFSLPSKLINSREELYNLKLKNSQQILHLDDIFLTSKDDKLISAYFDLYNKQLGNNSIILNTTNLVPKSSFIPKFNLQGFYFPFEHFFNNSGLSRRLGFTGQFVDGELPAYNVSLFCKNGVFFKYYPKLYKYQYLIIPIFQLLLSIFNPIFVLTFLLYYYVPLIEKEVVHNVNDYVFDSYKKFLNYREEIIVKNDIAPSNIVYDFKFSANSLSDISIPSVFELDRHLFTDVEQFNNTSMKWKMFIRKEVGLILQSSYEKFIINVPRVDRSVIINEIKRYVRLFKEYGIEPNLSIELGDFGAYIYHNGVIYHHENNIISSNIYHNSESVILNTSNDPIIIPFEDIVLSINLSHKYNLNFNQAIELSTYVSSYHFQSDLNFRTFALDYQNSLLKDKIQMEVKIVKDRILAFISTPIGKTLSITFSTLVLYFVSKKIYNLITPLFRQKRGDRKKKPNPKYNSDLDDEKRGDRKKKPNPKYNSDLDDEKVGSKRKRNPKYNSDIEIESKNNFKELVEMRKQRLDRMDVKNLVSMNDYSGYKNHIEIAYNKARKALGIVYIVSSDEPILSWEPVGQQACYCIFIGNKTLVTVGHIVKEVRRSKHLNVYIGHDDFNGKFYKANFRHVESRRDLSTWDLDGTPIPQFREIQNLFLRKSQVYSQDWVNAIIQRFGENKREEFIQGLAEIVEPFYYLDSDGIQEFGYVDFGTFDIQLTYYGDCGLPYYIVQRQNYKDKILGIHCMGNVEGYSTVGVMSLIYYEDVISWLGLENQSRCKFCDLDEPIIFPSEKPKCQLHEIVCSPCHESSSHTYFEEISYFLKLRPNFNGLIIKNSGDILYGSLEHSHTQFLHTDDFKHELSQGWKNSTFSELGFESTHVDPSTKIAYLVLHKIPYANIFTAFNRFSNLKNFRIHIQLYVENNKRYAKLALFVLDYDKPKSMKESISRQAMLPVKIKEEEIYVLSDIANIIYNYQRRLERGLSPDIPYDEMDNNESAFSIGVASRNMSPLPGAMYKQTQYYNIAMKYLDLYKLPVRFDPENAPAEQKQLLAVNHMGQFDQALTQAVKWAHPNYTPPLDLRKYCKEQYIGNFTQYYANLSKLNDYQLLHGFNKEHKLAGGLSGLELDSAIGWTLKQIFDVQKKQDILGLDEKGRYFWKQNECAEFQQHLLEVSKKQAREGKRYWTTFNELLKMEKLKPEKVWIPRSFVADDFNGILMERYVLGEFIARSVLWDPNCGVGTNAYSDFDRILRYLNKHPNMFTGDYKNFDKLLPACVFDDIRDMLCLVNPSMSNEIKSVFLTITDRIQICKSSMSLIRGGMPSGCLLTASLNSKCNDYMLYTAYVSLCWANALFDKANYIYYDKNVHRMFYGDDVIVTCSDEVSSFFDLSSLALQLQKLFGMVMTASSKSGELKRFETYNEASWISRFFRKMDKHDFYVGALKKISINTHFFYTTSTDPEHNGTLLQLAQQEAALWENDYFIQIQNLIREIIQRYPIYNKYFSFKSRLAIQDEYYAQAFNKKLVKCASSTGINTLNNEHIVCSSALREDKPKPVRYSKRDRERFLKALAKYPDNEALDCNFSNKRFANSFVNMSYYAKLNELFQKGITTKPDIVYSFNETSWTCDIRLTLIKEGKEHIGIGTGISKACAREEASLALFEAIHQQQDVREALRQIRQQRTMVPDTPLSLHRMCNDCLQPAIDLRFSTVKFQRQQFDPKMNSVKLDPVLILDELFEVGLIGAPDMICDYDGEQWGVNIKAFHIERNHYLYSFGLNKNKTKAIDMAAKRLVDEFECLNTMVFARQSAKEGPTGTAPGAPMVAPDPSVQPDSGIATNTMTPSVMRIINPTAMAIDNVYGSGAPFDKKEMCYSIYHRWTTKSTTINGSLNTGAEILRLSLNPSTLPKKLQEYAAFHEAFLPQLDIQLLIGGAAGSIGWLKLGWVPDDKKSYNLDQLQTVASEIVNLNTSITIQTLLMDNRRVGLFRKMTDDPEPYPALILMVEHPALNVQRNDDVNYPVIVNVRFGPGCRFMQPYNDLTSGGAIGSTIHLDEYLKITSLDLLIGASSFPDIQTKIIEFNDCGWNSGIFQPKFELENLHSIYFQHQPGQLIFYDSQNYKPKAGDVLDTGNVAGSWIGAKQYTARLIRFAFGKVPNVSANNVGFIQYGTEAPNLPGSIYAIPAYNLVSGIYCFACEKITVFEQGMVMDFLLDQKISSQFLGTYQKSSGGKDGEAIKIDSINGGNLHLLVDINSIPVEVRYQSPFIFDSKTAIGNGGDQYRVEKTNPTGAQLTTQIIANETLKSQFVDIKNIIELAFKTNNRFYEWSYILTSNLAPSTALPAGLASVSLVRPGTTCTVVGDAPFFPILAPDMAAVMKTLDEIGKTMNSDYIQMDLQALGATITTIAYGRGVFIGRTSKVKHIRTALTTNITLYNIRPIDSLQGLPTIPTANFQPWTQGTVSTIARFGRFQRQAAIAGQIAAGALGGLFNGAAQGLQFMNFMDYKERMQKNQQDFMRNLKQMEIDGNSALQKQIFDQKMDLLGRGSVSAQTGNGERVTTGTNTAKSIYPNSTPSDSTSLPAYSSSASSIGSSTNGRDPNDPLPHIPIDQEFIGADNDYDYPTQRDPTGPPMPLPQERPQMPLPKEREQLPLPKENQDNSFLDSSYHNLLYDATTETGTGGTNATAQADFTPQRPPKSTIWPINYTGYGNSAVKDNSNPNFNDVVAEMQAKGFQKSLKPSSANNAFTAYSDPLAKQRPIAKSSAPVSAPNTNPLGATPDIFSNWRNDL